MNLSDSEKKRHRTISVGITTLSISLLFLFFALKYIVEPGKDITTDQNDSTGVEVRLGTRASSPSETSNIVSAKESKSLNEKGDVVVKQQQENSQDISDKYKQSNSKNNNNSSSENTTTQLTGSGTVSVTGTNGESTIPADRNNMVMVELGRRKVESFPAMPTDMKEEGIVVVEIFVDKKGNVIEANPNGRGTNTSSAALRLKAKQIAFGIKFSEDNKVEEQKGSVKINFKFE